MEFTVLDFRGCKRYRGVDRDLLMNSVSVMIMHFTV